MVTRLELSVRPELADPRGERIASRVRSFLEIPIESVRTRDVYCVDARMSEQESRKVLSEFVDPVSQIGSLDRLDDSDFEQVVEVGYKPGVTDPVGKSARVAIGDTLGRPLKDDEAVYVSTLYMLRGVTDVQAERIAEELLANPVIQTIRVHGRDQWLAAEPDRSVPKITGSSDLPEVARVDLSGSDAELERISREGLLALTLQEMQTIRDHFRAPQRQEARNHLGLGDRPTDVELECLAQTWSEHCSHKIFNATVTYREGDSKPEKIESLFKQHIRKATGEVDEAHKKRTGESWLISVFHDNAGAVTFDDEMHLVYKVETHNSPSALDPYGGAITGIVGVNRDPFGTGLGCDLLVNVWGYCFGSPFHTGGLPKGLMHPRRIRDGVHRGVIDGGNQSGIPYGRGWEVFDHRYLGKPLVFCGTVGRMPVEVTGRPGESKNTQIGDLIVMTGGRIGADGIHGATFSSAALDESAPVQAVQIGDPITQKQMFDFLEEARDRGLYSSITDNGAGGLSSSVGEMAEATGGARLDLSQAPLKYPGLSAWEILVSEAQERMTLAVPPKDIDAFLALARRREVEASVIGTFTDDGFFHVTHGDQTVALLDMEFLHDGAPDLNLQAVWNPPQFEEPQLPGADDQGPTLLAMLSRLNLCSGEVKARRYDHEVKGLSVVKPFVGRGRDIPAEATVWLARHGSFRGFVLSEGVNPFFSDIDCHAMARSMVDEAVRRQLCAGARLDRIALLDNFCWPDPVQSEQTPDGEYKAAQLVRACRGLHEAVVDYAAPLVSGKDSMKNDAILGGVKISVPPTLLISAIGQIDDVRNAVTLEPKAAGERVYMIGETLDELGAGEYFRHLGDALVPPERRDPADPAPYTGNNVPLLDTGKTRPLYAAVEKAIGAGLIRSLATPTKGGWALSLARCAMAGALGLDLDLSRVPEWKTLGTERFLYSESNGRFLATVAPEHREAFEKAMQGQACVDIGIVTDSGRLVVQAGTSTTIDLDVETMTVAFKETLGNE